MTQRVNWMPSPSRWRPYEEAVRDELAYLFPERDGDGDEVVHGWPIRTNVVITHETTGVKWHYFAHGTVVAHRTGNCILVSNTHPDIDGLELDFEPSQAELRKP